MTAVDYRQVGYQLGKYLRAGKPTTQRIQGLLSDLLTGDELLLPMRDVVTRPWFRTLQDLAGSGQGSVQRDACLQELAKSYLPIIVDSVGQLFSGMLDLSESPKNQNTSKTGSMHAVSNAHNHEICHARLDADSTKDNLASEFAERRKYVEVEIKQLSIEPRRKQSNQGGIRFGSTRRTSNALHMDLGSIMPCLSSLVCPASFVWYVFARRSWKMLIYPGLAIVIWAVLYMDPHGINPEGIAELVFSPILNIKSIYLRIWVGLAVYLAAYKGRTGSR